MVFFSAYKDYKELISQILMEVLMILEQSKENPFSGLQQTLKLSSSPSKSFGSSPMRLVHYSFYSKALCMKSNVAIISQLECPMVPLIYFCVRDCYILITYHIKQSINFLSQLGACDELS